MRRPVVLVAIAFATVPLYLFTLTYLIAYAAILPAPRRWIAVFPNMRSGYLSWLFCAHLVAVTLASLPFAWSFARLYGRYTIAVSIAVAIVTGVVLGSPFVDTAIRTTDCFLKAWALAHALQFLVVLPVLAWLLQWLPSNNRWNGRDSDQAAAG